MEGIEAHKVKFGTEPRLIMVHETYRMLYGHFFTGRLHFLCCGKGAIFEGIPAIVTQSKMVEDYLICY